MKPIVLSISYRSNEITKSASFVYAGIETNKWIYVKLVKEEFSSWPKYIKVRKKYTYADSQVACVYCDEHGKKRYSFVQVLETDCSKADFSESNLIVKLNVNEEIISKVDEVLNTDFFKHIELVNPSDSDIRFKNVKY